MAELIKKFIQLHSETENLLNSDRIVDAKQKYFEAIEASEAMQNERKTCQLRIEVWRSINANRRHAA